METKDSRGKKRTLPININVSIWLTTLIVIVLILLLALTINHSREMDIVGQFGQQQFATIKVTAARTEDLIAAVRKSMVMMSSLPRLGTTTSSDEVMSMKAVYDYLEGEVAFIVRLDRNGTVLSGYPPSALSGQEGRNFRGGTFFRKIKETKKLSMGELNLGDAKNGSSHESIVIGVPYFHDTDAFSGAIFAVISAPAIIERYIAQAKGAAGRYHMLVDTKGMILTHPDVSLIGKDIGILERGGAAGKISLKDALRSGRQGYGEYILQAEGSRTERSIVAYVPIHAGAAIWSLAIITPYHTAVSPVRKTFINIMIGAAGLIIAVIIGSLSLSYAERRRLQLTDKLKLLQERSDWQEKLIREKKTMEGIIEGSPIPTFVIDREHRIIFWNKACVDLTGFDSQDMIGTDKQYMPFYPEERRPVLSDLIIDQDVEGLQRYYGKKRVQKSLIIEGAYEAGAYFENLGSRGRHLYFLAAPIYDEKGEIIAAIETLQDVSRQEEMDQHLREFAETLQDELRENINLRRQIESLYNYLQSLLDNSPDQLFDLNNDGTVNFMSRDLQRGKDLVSPQVKGKNIFEFVSPENKELMIGRWDQIRNGNYEPYEIEVKAKDGSMRNLLITPRPVDGTDRYLLVQRDITEFKNLKEKFYDSQKLAAIGQLSAGIAHEIRNPLSSIKMSLQILEKRMQPEGNDQKRFKIAQREVGHLEQLVNDVLIYAKPANLQKEPTDIKKVLDHVVAMAEKDITDKHILVQTQYEEKTPVLMADAAMLEQALLNLCLNALDAMEDGGKLRIVVKGEGRSVTAEIEDNGCGIDEQDMPHIFNPFFTTKRYGTGLGLTPVKKIVELHQGTIEIFSKKGEGTRVVVTLPVDEITETGETGLS